MGRVILDFQNVIDSISSRTFYIFVMNEPPNISGRQGFMPYMQPYGFIYLENVGNNEFARAIAHELGHGGFALPHTFPTIPEGTTANLMDYGTGTNLWALQ